MAAGDGKVQEELERASDDRPVRPGVAARGREGDRVAVNCTKTLDGMAYGMSCTCRNKSLVRISVPWTLIYIKVL
jgi:hypothetical protein